MDADEWISWDTAAELTGIRVPTIEHAVRVGRIERRDRYGNHPSLSRSSVLEWAAWYAEHGRPRRPESERVGRRSPPTPPPEGWIEAKEAARRLGRSVSTVLRRIEDGEFDAVRSGRAGRWWLDPASVEAAALEQGRWVSWAEAAEIAGCSPSSIGTAVGQGLIESRSRPRAVPSLLRSSVEAYAEGLARRTSEPAIPAPEVSGPPDDGHVWLSTTVVAIMLGVRRADVARWVRAERLPGVKRGSRVWVRREHAEAAAAARAHRQ